MKNRIICALVVIALICSVIVPIGVVQGANSGNFGDGLTWSYNSGSGALTISGTGAMPDFAKATAPWYSIRNKIYSINIEQGITSIGDWAFGYLYYVRMINLPSDLERVGSYAFYNCFAIEEILLPETVTEIGSAAFSYCKKLQGVSVPVSITTVPNYTFYGCNTLTNVYYAGSQANWNAINKSKGNTPLDTAKVYVNTLAGTTWNFDSATGTLTVSGYGRTPNYDAKTAPWYTHASSIKKVVVEEGVTGLGNWAFSYCTKITDVVLPETLVHIGSSAFYNCTSLVNINIPEGVTRIFSGAFYKCSSLVNITIPIGVTTIYANTFLSCSKLANVSYNGTAVQWAKVEVLANNTVLNNLSINYLVKSIEWTISSDGTLTISGGVAMDDYELNKDPKAPWAAVKTQVRRVVIEDGIPNIGKNSFYGCTNLTEVVIPDSVTSIGYGAFWSCNSLVNIELPETVTYLGAAAFYNCPNLESIKMPSTLTSVLAHTFYNCKKLSTVYYMGTQEQFDKLSVVATNNQYFTSANVVCVTPDVGPTFEVSAVKAAPGDTVEVAININNNPGILGMTLAVGYDDSALSLVSASNGGALTMLTLTKPKTFEDGCRFVWDGVEVAKEDVTDGEVLVLTFEVKASASGNYPVEVSYTAGDIIGIDLSEVSPAITNGSIAVA